MVFIPPIEVYRLRIIHLTSSEAREWPVASLKTLQVSYTFNVQPNVAVCTPVVPQ